MLCKICEPFLADLLNRDFVSWRHVQHGWYTYKHGDYASLKAAAGAGCQTCCLFDIVRAKRIKGYQELGEKWRVQPSSIDYKHEYGKQQSHAGPVAQQQETREQWTFYLLTVLPVMSWIPFEIFVPGPPSESDTPEAVIPTLPRAVSSSPIDTAAVDIASSWLTQCLTSHSHCSRPERAPLPTRILDIQPSGSTFNLRLQVNKGHQGQYITLSHCWGLESRLTLCKANLLSFQHEVPFDQLPRTFADAVRLTASLGQRYLWIDALCILQDDQDDWRREAASMCSVFENALFSISALNADDSHSGLLNERHPSEAKPIVQGKQIGVRERLPSLDEALEQSKLETRAWCLQERLLAPRILHIAPGQLYWECRTFVISETAPKDSQKNDSGNASRPFTTTRKLVALQLGEDDHHAHWLDLVAGYSSRDLTKPSDRLPAISGLAEKAKRELGLGTYVHGLWLDDIHAGLLWWHRPKRRSASAAEPGQRFLSPSWSWVSSLGAVEYPLLDAGYRYQPTNVDMTLKSRQEDHKGAVHGSLSIIGRMKRGYCKIAARPATPYETVFKASGSLLVDEGLSCFMDEADEPTSKACYCLLVAMFEQKPPNRQKAIEQQRLGYLVLERAQNHTSAQNRSDEDFGTFRRIGTGFEVPKKVEKVFGNAERRRLDLI